jgi:pimeloyl-ACP methyl ester carboxylesterase
VALTVTVRTVPANGIDIEVATAGEGPTLLLLHGFPHTWRVWSAMIQALARARHVIAADLRGLGGSSRAAGGYDAMTLSRDAESLLDALGAGTADIAAIDAGAPPAFVLAMRRPDRIRKMILMESTLGRLPGAEDFFAAGPPWWFGFHAVPGLAESVLAGHEGAYLDFFYRAGMRSGRVIDPAVRDAFVEAYSGQESLRCGFGHYRAIPESARQLSDLAARSRLRVPTLAIGSHPVGDALRRQLAPITDDLHGELIADCGHIIPLDRPDAALALFSSFLASPSAEDAIQHVSRSNVRAGQR